MKNILSFPHPLQHIRRLQTTIVQIKLTGMLQSRGGDCNTYFPSTRRVKQWNAVCTLCQVTVFVWRLMKSAKLPNWKGICDILSLVAMTCNNWINNWSQSQSSETYQTQKGHYDNINLTFCNNHFSSDIFNSCTMWSYITEFMSINSGLARMKYTVETRLPLLSNHFTRYWGGNKSTPKAARSKIKLGTLRGRKGEACATIYFFLVREGLLLNLVSLLWYGSEQCWPARSTTRRTTRRSTTTTSTRTTNARTNGRRHSDTGTKDAATGSSSWSKKADRWTNSKRSRMQVQWRRSIQNF